MASNLSKLPCECYHVTAFGNEIVRLVRGMQGYYPTDIVTDTREQAVAVAGEQNQKLGVTKAQAEAMFVGSLFGWNVAGANPDNYDENGMPKRHS